MSDIKAGIVVVTEFCSSDDGAFSSYIDYMDRDEATRKDHLSEYNLFDGYMDYMGDTEKTSGLFTRANDVLNTEQVKDMKNLFQTAQANGSLMWQTVISFDNRYLELMGAYDSETRMLDEKRLTAIARKAIDKMLESEGLNNGVWTASFHFNTDNIHIHVATVEPNPQRESQMYAQYEKERVDGKITYKLKENEETGKKERIPLLDKNGNVVRKKEYKGKFKLKSIEVCKSEIRKELDVSKEASKEITSLIRDVIVRGKKESLLINDKDFKRKFEKLYSELPKNVSRNLWTYKGQLMQPYKSRIDQLSRMYIQKYHREDFMRLEEQLDRQSEVYKMSYGSDNNYKETKIDDLYYRLGNAILQEVKSYDKVVRERQEQVATEKRQLILFNKYMSVSNRNYKWGDSALRVVFRYLQTSLNRSYERWKNQQEYDTLQRKISEKHVDNDQEI